MTAREVLLPPAPAPTLPDLCRVAATAIETLCATIRDCAREVETRDGRRVARGRLDADTDHASNKLARVLSAYRTPLPLLMQREIVDMIDGCREHYVRPTWALRLMQLAADAPEPRDRVPAEAPEDTEPRPAGCLCTWEFGDSACPVHPTCPACGCVVCECRPTEAPEEHAGEGGT